MNGRGGEVVVLGSPTRRGLAAGAIGLLAASVATLALSTGGASGTIARAAHTITLNESGRLHLTSHHTTHLNLQGTASGTIRGTIYIHLNVTSPSRVSAEVSIYPSSGSLTGLSTASYRANGGQATFSGTMSISRGSGRYAHAHASALRFSGTIQRSNDATTVRVSGPLSY
jgi:hypothetical protein